MSSELKSSEPPAAGATIMKAEVRLPEGVKLPDGTIWEGHHVLLERFEGPLDLLLFLIREKKINICDINISEITAQFLIFARALQEKWSGSMDELDVIGDFLVMAATLIQIKTRELLPPDDSAALDDAEMTRDELIRLLQEYERFKAAASNLEARMKERSRIFIRNRPSLEPEQEEILKVDLTKLIAAFQMVLRRAPQTEVRELARETIKIEDRIEAMTSQLEQKGNLLFSELFGERDSRRLVIATFLALLELMRSEKISVVQTGILGEIRIVWRENP